LSDAEIFLARFKLKERSPS